MAKSILSYFTFFAAISFISISNADVYRNSPAGVDAHNHLAHEIFDAKKELRHELADRYMPLFDEKDKLEHEARRLRDTLKNGTPEEKEEARTRLSAINDKTKALTHEMKPIAEKRAQLRDELDVYKKVSTELDNIKTPTVEDYEKSHPAVVLSEHDKAVIKHFNQFSADVEKIVNDAIENDHGNGIGERSLFEMQAYTAKIADRIKQLKTEIDDVPPKKASWGDAVKKFFKSILNGTNSWQRSKELSDELKSQLDELEKHANSLSQSLEDHAQTLPDHRDQGEHDNTKEPTGGITRTDDGEQHHQSIGGETRADEHPLMPEDRG